MATEAYELYVVRRDERLPAFGGKTIHQRRINAANDALMVNQGVMWRKTKKEMTHGKENTGGL